MERRDDGRVTSGDIRVRRAERHGAAASRHLRQERDAGGSADGGASGTGGRPALAAPGTGGTMPAAIPVAAVRRTAGTTDAASPAARRRPARWASSSGGRPPRGGTACDQRRLRCGCRLCDPAPPARALLLSLVGISLAVAGLARRRRKGCSCRACASRGARRCRTRPRCPSPA